MQKIVLSIVTWNSEATINACIESVLAQTFRDFALVIVDNNSTDNTSSIIRSFYDSRITFIPNAENRGFCGAHNQVIQGTSSEFVMLVNPDIIMSPNYIENALKSISEDSAIGTLCGLLLQSEINDPDVIIDSAGLEIRNSRIMQMKYHGLKLRDIKLRKEDVFGADGALPLYRRRMIDDISFEGDFFDEMFFAHKEDWDISWRSRLFGWRTIFDPACIAIHPRHFKPKSLKVRKGIDRIIKIHSVKNQLLLHLKNESVWSFLWHMPFILPRQLVIFFYILLHERSSLGAYKFVYDNYDEIKRKRKFIQDRTTVQRHGS